MMTAMIVVYATAPSGGMAEKTKRNAAAGQENEMTTKYILDENLRPIKHIRQNDGLQHWTPPDIPITLCDHNYENDAPLFKARLLAARERNEVLVINQVGYVITVSSCMWPRCAWFAEADDKRDDEPTRFRCRRKHMHGYTMVGNKWRCGGRFHSESRRPAGIKPQNIIFP